MDTEKYLNTNRAHWNERVSIHKKSEFYSLDKFKRGVNQLHSLEREELGDIRGKSVLHLQCHFGIDTLSLEMLGADVTGIDFSEEAIKTADEIRDGLGMKAKFILSDIYSLPEKLDKKFDIVYTSYGVLIWLPDLVKWGQTVSHFLKPGGFFYIAECHPFAYVFDNERNTDKLEIKYPYFSKSEPIIFNEEGSYADKEAKTKNNVTYEWAHSLSDIFMALINAGLKIEFFHEHNFTVWQHFPVMKQDADGYFRFDKDIPLLFSLMAVKM